jgi:dUTP pyrophosphatase
MRSRPQEPRGVSAPIASGTLPGMPTSTATAVQLIEVPIRMLPGHEDLPLPGYQSQHAAGMDMHAAVPADQPVTLEPGRTALIPCGFAMAVPVGYEAQVRPRSGLATRHGVTMINAPGTIDADYRGEVKVPLINHGSEPFTITRGTRIAQMLVCPVPRVQWLPTDTLDDTARGEGGFGHTGH